MVLALMFIAAFLLICFYIDKERKRNGKSGVPLLGDLFDQINVNFVDPTQPNSPHGQLLSQSPSMGTARGMTSRKRSSGAEDRSNNDVKKDSERKKKRRRSKRKSRQEEPKNDNPPSNNDVTSDPNAASSADVDLLQEHREHQGRNR
ncbi:hypothetical protein M3Y95_00611100 [Aphelenchoides besseyi]|nr:hypothetical protein M3Y95_00611100 [Aphelenchoides besseyi]